MHKPHTSLLIFLAMSVLALASPAPASVVYVDSAAIGLNDGTNWDNAFVDLQTALTLTTQGEIWVAAGTYYPGAAGAQFATFQLKNGVALYGGFAGTEVSRSERDVQANVTQLNGDINKDDTYGTGLNWWQVSWNGNAGNSFHIVTGTGVDATAELDGFTIFAGLGGDPTYRGGGGLLVNGGSPSIRNCTFQYNALGYGSAARLQDCNSTFESCIIRDGYACNCGAGGWTSGVLCLGTSNVTFLDCDFINHYYVSTQDQGRGAALNIDFASTGTLIRCRFVGNQTGNFYAIGGGTAYGAAVFAGGDVVIEHCEFLDNFGHAGCGVTAWSNATVTDSLFARNRAVPHPSGSGFNNGNFGAGFLTLGSGLHNISITDCTFVDNNCDKGAGLALYGQATGVIRNSIVYDNYANPPGAGEDPIWILKQQLVGSYDIANSCVEGLLQTEPDEDPPDPLDFPGCIDVDPLMVGVQAEDYQLLPTSPCIDAGDNTAVPVGVITDLLGASRFVDDPGTPDTGVGTAPIVDMGAYEFGAAAWTDLGFGLAGTNGVPFLAGMGELVAGNTVTISLTSANQNSLAFFIAGAATLYAPLWGGTLVPLPTVILPLPTGPSGSIQLPIAWPSSTPSGTTIYLQVWIDDPIAPFGFAASNAISATVP